MLFVIRTADGLFLRDRGGEALAADESAVTVVGTPDARMERYDSGSPTGRRAASPAEIAAFDGAAKDADAASRVEDVLIRALGRATWEELQKMQPKAGQTPLDFAAFRDRVKAIARQLL